MTWKSDEPEYCSPFDGEEHPIAKLYRREWNAEVMRLAVIDRLLAGIGPKDLEPQLFTFAERREWGLRLNARRASE